MNKEDYKNDYAKNPELIKAFRAIQEEAVADHIDLIMDKVCKDVDSGKRTFRDAWRLYTAVAGLYYLFKKPVVKHQKLQISQSKLEKYKKL
jgi:hypothetical protein